MKEHLNWALFFMWALCLTPIYIGGFNESLLDQLWFLIIFIIGLIGYFVSAGWYLRQKRQSQYNLFWLILHGIGWAVIFSLKNKRAETEGGKT